MSNRILKAPSSQKPGWTSKTLLAEGFRLIERINKERDPEKIKILDGCFRAVQETLMVADAQKSQGDDRELW